MKKRIFLDDINQAWTSIDLDTGLMSGNDYNRDLYRRGEYVFNCMYHARIYWGNL